MTDPRNINTPEQPRDPLEKSLAEMTRWDGPSPNLWRKALQQQPAPQATNWNIRALRFPRAPLAAAAVLVLAAVIGIAFLPELRPSARPAKRVSEENVYAMRNFAAGRIMQSQPPTASTLAERGDDDAESSLGPSALRSQVASKELAESLAWAEVQQPAENLRRSRSPEAPGRASAEVNRQIIRRISMELHTPDVRAVFAQAMLIPSAAHGEYVQASSLVGEGKEARAELTLRIASTRLDAALIELRSLGTVHTERAAGEDVTTQIVDLSARLRNEQRIESELVNLLDKRADAPLNDVMTVRRSLDEVRQQIERLSAQRENLGRMVSLSTVLIIIRAPADDEPQPAPANALGDYFKSTIYAAWRSGLSFLADSLGFLISLFIGGLIWWAMIAAAVTIYVYQRRRAIIRGIA